MIIKIEAYGKKFSVETDYDDLSVEEYLNIIEGLLIQIGFSKNNVVFGFRDKTDSLLEELDD